MKIDFKYSTIYEGVLNKEGKPLDMEVVNTNLSLLREFWGKEGSKIEQTLKEVTGLSFTEETIPCYLNTQVSISDPLSVRIEDPEIMKDNLVHELIHVLLRHNFSTIKQGWEAMFAKHPTEPFTTKVHVGVHAIHALYCEKASPDRLEFIKNYSKRHAYIRSWEIVNEVGAQSIVDLILQK